MSSGPEVRAGGDRRIAGGAWGCAAVLLQGRMGPAVLPVLALCPQPTPTVKLPPICAVPAVGGKVSEPPHGRGLLIKVANAALVGVKEPFATLSSPPATGSVSEPEDGVDGNGLGIRGDCTRATAAGILELHALELTALPAGAADVHEGDVPLLAAGMGRGD